MATLWPIGCKVMHSFESKMVLLQSSLRALALWGALVSLHRYVDIGMNDDVRVVSFWPVKVRRETERSAETRPATICNTVTFITPILPPSSLAHK